jgi:urease accessory protein
VPSPSRTGYGGSSSSSPDGGRRVGRDGSISLDFARRDGRTVLTQRHYTLPLQVLEPMELEAGAATLMLLNPTGGVLGGDRLHTEVRLGAGSHACLTTPSATRVYRTGGPPAVLTFRASLGAGARLEYVPDHLIPSPGARVRQATELVLAPGAAALLLDAWSVGRPARGERWDFAELDLALTVSDAGGPILRDRACLGGSRSWDGLGGAEGHAYVATFAAVRAAGEHGEADWEALARSLSAAVSECSSTAQVGVSPLSRSGALARVLAPSAPALLQVTDRLWAASRGWLFSLPPLALRKL